MHEDELRDALAELDARLQEIHAAAEGRALNDEEQTEWDEKLAQWKAHAEELRQIEQRKAEVRALAALPGHTESVDPLGEPGSVKVPNRANPWDLDAVTRSLTRDTPERGGAELRSRAAAAIEHASGVNARSKQHITQLLEGWDLEGDDEASQSGRRVAAHIIATSSPEYMRAWTRAFKTAMRTGQPDMQALGVLQRAMSLTDNAGGFAVPLPVDPTLILDDDGSQNPFRQISTIRTITTDQLRTVNTDAASFSWDGEATEVSDDSTTFGNTDITVHKAQGFIPFTIEISQDYPGFTEDVRMLLADGRDSLEATAHATGSGSSQPFGIVTALDGGTFDLAGSGTEAVAVDDVYLLEAELPARFRQNASWVANHRIYNAIRQLGGTNLPHFWVNLGGGQPAELMGYRTYEASGMDTIDAAVTADSNVLILGDFRNYWIVDRVGFSIELVPHLFGTTANLPTGERGFYAYWRTGADSVRDRAFRMLSVATTL